MKTRKGFVSNSSSTSFIVGVEDNTEIELHIKVDLARYGDVIDNKEELDEYFQDRYWQYDEDEEYWKEEYDKCIAVLEAGKKLIIGDFSDDAGDDLSGFLCNHGIPESPGIEIIHSEEGY